MVPANQTWELEDSLPTGKKLPVRRRYDLRKRRPLSELELDDIYSDLQGDSRGFVHCRLVDADAGVQTTVGFSQKEFPEVVIYTAPAPRQAVCVEPYTCPTNALNLANQAQVRSNLLILPPSQSARWTIRIEMRNC